MLDHIKIWVCYLFSLPTACHLCKKLHKRTCHLRYVELWVKSKSPIWITSNKRIKDDSLCNVVLKEQCMQIKKILQVPGMAYPSAKLNYLETFKSGGSSGYFSVWENIKASLTAPTIWYQSLLAGVHLLDEK